MLALFSGSMLDREGCAMRRVLLAVVLLIGTQALRADAQSPPPAWNEEWTGLACARPAVLSVRFTPGATGTGFAVGLKR